jgi:biopolymer transport protein TolR
MRKKAGRRKPMSEINVVPYIDVTLVLLIIFMITTPLLQTGVDVDLPDAEAKVVEPKNDPPIIVSIDSQAQFFIDLGDHKEVPVSEEEVVTRVSSVLHEKPDTPVYIRGDQAVDYGKVVTAMAALKNAGVPSVGLMTRPKQ